MNLEKVEIKNFRSIVDETIYFNYNCIGLVGLNESGKTNILDALNFFNRNLEMKESDVSKITKDKPIICFYFKDIGNYIQENLLVDLKKTYSIPKNININDIIKDINIKNLKMKVEYKKPERTEHHIEYDLNDIKINGNYFYKIKNFPNNTNENDNISINSNEDIKSYLKKYDIIEGEKIPKKLSGKYFVSCKDDTFKNDIIDIIHSTLSNNFPNITFWNYKEKYLLPSQISYDKFIENDKPAKNSLPLFNILKLIEELEINNVDDLKNKIEIWKNDSSERRKTSAILNEKINNYVNGIWNEFDQDIVFNFEKNDITIHVNDPESSQKNYYEFTKRSQGFKTFISFIFTIAVEYDNNQLENNILLLDEPESHLHPSGVKYMRDKLIELSDSNLIIFATHSLFMIDRSELQRHLLVEKEEEETITKEIDDNSMLQEEVIYQALGTHIDEFAIPMKNIIFEGEIDLKIFDYYNNKFVDNNKNEYKDYHLHDLQGTKNIKKFFKKKFIPPDSEWIVILDKDKAGIKCKKFLENQDINCDIEVIFYGDKKFTELEDLIKYEKVKDLLNESVKNLQDVENIQLPKEANKPFFSLFEKYVNRSNISQKNKKKIIKSFKENFEKYISDKLGEINKLQTKKEKRDKFKKEFPKYLEFLNNNFNKKEQND